MILECNKVETETNRPVEIRLKNGDEYRIKENDFGEIEVMCCSGKMIILPHMTNVVYIKQEK